MKICLNVWYSISLKQFFYKISLPADSGQMPSKQLGWVRLPQEIPF